MVASVMGENSSVHIMMSVRFRSTVIIAVPVHDKSSTHVNCNQPTEHWHLPRDNTEGHQPQGHICSQQEPTATVPSSPELASCSRSCFCLASSAACGSMIAAPDIDNAKPTSTGWKGMGFNEFLMSGKPIIWPGLTNGPRATSQW